MTACNVCGREIRDGQSGFGGFINLDGGGTNLAHLDCIADAHITSTTGRIVTRDSAPKCARCGQPMFQESDTVPDGSGGHIHRRCA